nr:hypothetical protein [Tanacetum cinerariifolium]
MISGALPVFRPSIQHKASLTYDGFGREAVRTFDFGDERQQLTQRYNEVDALVQRTLERVYTDGTPAQILRDEQYEYDLRARLRHYRCTGTECPLDPYGKTLKEQVFDFDARDHHLCRRHADPAYPALITLDYDLDGNLTVDEQGRHLEYDDIGRLRWFNLRSPFLPRRSVGEPEGVERQPGELHARRRSLAG